MLMFIDVFPRCFQTHMVDESGKGTIHYGEEESALNNFCFSQNISNFVSKLDNHFFYYGLILFNPFQHKIKEDFKNIYGKKIEKIYKLFYY